MPGSVAVQTIVVRWGVGLGASIPAETKEGCLLQDNNEDIACFKVSLTHQNQLEKL